MPDSQKAKLRVLWGERALVRELAAALADCRTVLELGCGPQSPMRHFAARLQLEGLDVHEPSLRAYEATGLLHKGHLGRVQDAGRLFRERSFDAVVALDLIEHLEKAEGEQLLDDMGRIARRRVVVFTPNGFVLQEGRTNPWMKHLSGWELGEFATRGFSVAGLGGPKGWRAAEARIVRSPRWFWAGLAELWQRGFGRRNPARAFALFCVKRIGDK